ncbi:hypothetical protein AALP_AA3G063700 [Arabis alpina]|uniref:Uncharacterized protein n=1 Tax=Arabis alpina TaxID=50452 RepID=A0A087H7E8_ARAAL|nr:hypothetical protein AALP_AA3G063700 [Arabis alpina]
MEMMSKTSKMKFTKEMIESIKDKLPRLSFLLLFLRQCYGGCGDRTHLLPCSITTGSTRFWNFSDRPVELQIRVGSILKRVHTLKPGRSKRLRHSNIQRAYVADQEGRRWLYYDDTSLPYVWVHETGTDLSKMVKQQYVSLEDLRDYSEIRVYKDLQRGCVSVEKRDRASALC